MTAIRINGQAGDGGYDVVVDGRLVRRRLPPDQVAQEINRAMVRAEGHQVRVEHFAIDGTTPLKSTPEEITEAINRLCLGVPIKA